MEYSPVFCFWPYSEELIVLAVFLISHYGSGPGVRFAFIALLASIKTNSNMFQSLRQLCVHPFVNCVHCVTLRHLSPTLRFYGGKNDSVQTQWRQGQKRIVGARLYTEHHQFIMLQAH